MMRSLWTAASGMKTQQLAVDIIANNLSNVNTYGFKKERVEFKSLLYETMHKASEGTNSSEPVNLQVGHGVRPAGTVKNFSQGNIERTENPLDFTISGNGFFAVQDSEGNISYSRDGAFKISVLDNQVMLTSVNGDKILNTEGEPLLLEGAPIVEKIKVDEQGIFTYDINGEVVELGQQIGLVQFKNTAGLEALGNGLFNQTVASGGPIPELGNEEMDKSKIIQGTLESSNVQAIEEMVKMIVAQRAYELNSKSIQTSDDMLSMANSLKR